MSSDSGFREQFDRMKREDELSARPFSAYWQDARQSAGRRGAWVLNFGAIAAVLALVAVVAFVVHVRSPRQASIGQISQWRSPTDSLLRTPGNQLFTTMPRFGDSVLPSFKESFLKEQRN
jgi:hypothetical protein